MMYGIFSHTVAGLILYVLISLLTQLPLSVDQKAMLYAAGMMTNIVLFTTAVRKLLRD